MRLVAAVVPLLAACTPQYPGEAVGSFDVTGRLEVNECGASAVPARDPLSFAVEVRERGPEAFWRRSGLPVVSGTVRDDGNYRFRTVALIPVFAADPDPDFGHAGCNLVQTEIVDVVLSNAPPDADAGAETDAGPGMDAPDAGAQEPEPDLQLAGTSTIDLAPEPGSDCTPLMAVAGGPFVALPCGIDYTLEGAPRSPL